MYEQNVFDYIKSEETRWATDRVPLTKSKDWNMKEHIERCTNVSNGWYHSGKNDGLRPYDDIVTPILNVAFRSEGFDVKDIVPYVNDVSESYKSFVVKKFHPQWARKHELDTFIDDVVESSVIYDLVLVKNVNNERPEVVDLKTIAFCDQTDIMAAPICIKHQLTPTELNEYKGKWYDDKIDEAIVLAKPEKSVAIANDRKVHTPSKYIEVYELRGSLPEFWLNDDGEVYKTVPQTQIVCFYKDSKGERCGITLYKGKDKPLSDNFKALKIDRIRSKGRACGRSIVETLFEPQVWANYDAQKIKQLLDGAITIFQTDDENFKNQNVSDIKTNTILSHQPGKPITKVDGQVQNLPAFQSHQQKMESDARVLGSASDAQLGTNPVSGTPFALQQLVVQQGQGFHEYRQGKIATFFADVLYRDWILNYLVKDLNTGKDFSEELTLDEMIEIGDTIARNKAEEKVIQLMLDGKYVEPSQKETLIETFKQEFMKGGSRKFFQTIKDEFAEIPVEVFVNIKGKQRYMAQNADKISNLLTQIISNPQAFSQIPGVAKAFNQLLEESGMSSIDFSQITKAPAPQPQPTQPTQPEATQSVETPPVAGGQ